MSTFKFDLTQFQGRRVKVYIPDLEEHFEGRLLSFDMETWFFEEKNDCIHFTAQVKPDSDQFDEDELIEHFLRVPVENMVLA